MLLHIFQLLVSCLVIFSGFFIYSSNTKRRINFIFFLFSLSIFCWLFSSFISYVSIDDLRKIFWFKISYIGIIFIAITFYHFITILLNEEYDKILVKISYAFGLFFVFLLSVNQLIIGLYHYEWGEYPKVSYWHILFLIFFCSLFSLSLVRLLLPLLRGNPILLPLDQSRIKYLFVGGFIGTIGSIDFFPNYGISIYPIGFIFILIFYAILGYAIYKYRLLDIKLVLTRVSIFGLVYTLVLGIPIWIGFKLLGSGLWLFPVLIMGFFATAGPFIYLYIQKQAENRLLQEQHRYQATLRQASAGMGKIKDLKKLLNMIVYVLTHAIQIEHALVYIYDKTAKNYVLGASKKRSGQKQFVEKIDGSSPLVKYLLDTKKLLIFEEIKQRSEDYKDSVLTEVAQNIAALDGALIVPIFIDQDLTAVILMGKKDSGKAYAEDDLAVFGILANQTALAIENAKFYEDMKLTQEQLFQAEKMATIGTMADGLSHQINNRFHVLGFIAGDAIDTIRLYQKEPAPQKTEEIMGELDRAFVRIQENVVQGGEIVQGLLKYTRKGDAGFAVLDVDAVFKASLEMVQYKIKIQELKIIREYDPALIPKIKGNFTQLQEVFFNLIDNSYDAMMQRKDEAKEAAFQPTLRVRVFVQDNYAKIVFEDNGIGVKEDDLRKLFTPFFTTKLSSKKGTGLGLYVIKKIVEDNHKGSVEMVSKYMHGTQIKLSLPIAIG